jgi:hypothetical protein
VLLKNDAESWSECIRGETPSMYILTDYILLIVFIFIVLHFLVVLIVFEYGFVESNISFLMPS